MKINLTTEPEMVELQSQVFLYLEAIGPFMKTAPQCWQDFWQFIGSAATTLPIVHMAGLSRIDESKTGDAQFIYQAGAFLKTEPNVIPKHLQVRNTKPGKYAKFVLTGSYNQLPEAYPKAFEILATKNIPLRNDFCIEIYVNNPQTTAEAELKTEILIPIH